MKICCLGVWGSKRNLSYSSDSAVSTTDEGWVRNVSLAWPITAYFRTSHPNCLAPGGLTPSLLIKKELLTFEFHGGYQ
jgi:hypothetical protein